jgi:hypothetical protein
MNRFGLESPSVVEIVRYEELKSPSVIAYSSRIQSMMSSLGMPMKSYILLWSQSPRSIRQKASPPIASKMSVST